VDGGQCQTAPRARRIRPGAEASVGEDQGPRHEAEESCAAKRGRTVVRKNQEWGIKPPERVFSDSPQT
jgi:hypothetical protein